jgi:hypothetical protein
MTETFTCPYIVVWRYRDGSGYGVSAIFRDLDDAEAYIRHFSPSSHKRYRIWSPTDFDCAMNGFLANSDTPVEEKS